MDTKPIAGRTAIVTGGGRGLGRAAALGLARAGATVIITAARERSEIEAVARDAESSMGTPLIHPLVADVANPNDCERVVREVINRFGRIDILVNNAGRGMKYVSDEFLNDPTRFWDVEPETWRMIIDTNVNGPFFMARSVVPHMLAAGWGRIVNISMNRETMKRRGFSPYGPSKAALESETIIWAQDLSGTGVTVNTLLPGGATLTGMIPPGVSEQVQDSLLQPDIIVPPLVWLTSGEADGVTGKRITATLWPKNQSIEEIDSAIEDAGW